MSDRYGTLIMLLDDTKRRRQLTRWIVSIIAACSLIYLGVRHLNVIAKAVSWLADLFLPLLIGGIMALILNVPLTAIERHLFRKTKNTTLHRLRRPLAILLSLALVIGIFVGVAVLVIPELVDAAAVIAQMVNNAFDQLAHMEEAIDLSYIPFGEQIAGIDWLKLKSDLGNWLLSARSSLLESALAVISSTAGIVLDLFVGLFFSIYFLAGKEKLKKQVRRMIHVWLPERVGNKMIHVASVCVDTFHSFIAGQTIEAIILGVLCTIGMLILGLPYAPMIGALVGVTALIPIVGAFVGTVVGFFMILTVSPLQAIIFVAFLLVLQQFEGNLIYPKVVGRKINLPAVWVLAAITVGGGLAGPLGMLLGVPATSAAYALLREATEAREAARRTVPKRHS